MLEQIWIIILIAVALCLFLIENYRGNKGLISRSYTIESEKVPESFHGKKIIFLSDLHNNTFGKENEKLIRMIDEEKPDYIFVGGDMLVSKRAQCFQNAVSLLEKLAARYPVYCANGNHEERLRWKTKKHLDTGVIYENYIAAVKKAGVIHLDNETVWINEKDSHLVLSGLELERRFYRKFEQTPMDTDYMIRKIGPASEEYFHVLLAHNPDYFDVYTEWGADLTLSGHVHGGIMRLPWLGGVISPSYHLFPKYDAGLFEEAGKKMIISTGLGCHSIKIRLFNPPAFDVITLKKKEEPKYDE